MKQLLTKIAVTLAVLTLVSCGGGGGGGNDGYSHSELAKEFVARLDAAAPSGEYVELIKTNTDEWDYIVVYDSSSNGGLGSYDAYFIGDYVYGESVANYLVYYGSDVYTDLYPEGDSTFEDLDTYSYYENWWDTVPTVTFEETETNSKDLEKVGAFMEALIVAKASESIASQFGLSESRSLQIAKVTVAWQKASKQRSMTDADADAFSTEILGVSITDAKEAFEKSLKGDNSDMESLIDQASELNGTSPEHMGEIVSSMITQ